MAKLAWVAGGMFALCFQVATTAAAPDGGSGAPSGGAVPKKLELYTATSQIFGDQGAGFDNSSEYLVGMNIYPADTRNHRLNLQLIDVNGSPVSSAFGYYVGGQTGKTLAASFSVLLR